MVPSLGLEVLLPGKINRVCLQRGGEPIVSVKVMCFHSTPQTLRHTHTHLGKTNTHTLLPTLCYILFQLYSTAFYHGPLKKKMFLESHNIDFRNH